MQLFTRRRAHPRASRTTHSSSTRSFARRWHRKDPDRVAGGYKAAIANPNTTRSGRKHAKAELRAMGRTDKVHTPLSVRIKNMFGIKRKPRRTSHVTID